MDDDGGHDWITVDKLDMVGGVGESWIKSNQLCGISMVVRQILFHKDGVVVARHHIRLHSTPLLLSPLRHLLHHYQYR